MYDLIIIGAGPAGVSASIYASSRGLDVLVIEKSKVGGIIGGVSTVSHYASASKGETGVTFAKKLEDQLLSTTAKFIVEEVKDVNFDGDIKEVTTNKDTYKAKAVIIASGSTPKRLDVLGAENFYGRFLGVNPLKTAEEFKGRNMYVIGGADGAVKEAIYLSKFGAKVTIVCVEDELSCIYEFKEKVNTLDNIKVISHSSLNAIKGDEEIEEIELIDNNTKEITKILDKGAIIYTYIGLTPNTSMYESLETENGYIVTNSDMETNIKGVFASGDIIKKSVRQVSTAVNDGTIAGVNAFKYVSSLGK